VSFKGAANSLLIVVFIIPIPVALWANLSMIAGSMELRGELLDGVDGIHSLIGYILASHS